MRYFPLSSVSEAVRWAQRLCQQLERDFSELKGGKGEITLVDGSATTTLADGSIGAGRQIALMPMTANAAAALSSLYFDTPSAGIVVINHANNAQTDRTFHYLVLG